MFHKIYIISYWLPVLITFIVFTRWEEMQPMSLAQRLVLALFPGFNFTVMICVATTYMVDWMEAGWRKLGKVG